MPKRASAFTKSEVRAAVKAALDAGLEVGRVEFRKDGFAVIVGKPTEALNELDANPWDEVLLEVHEHH